MPKYSEVAAFRDVPKKLIYLGIFISLLGQFTGVPILSHKMCELYGAPDQKILVGSLNLQASECLIKTDDDGQVTSSACAPSSKDGGYVNQCSAIRQVETYIGMMGAVVSQIVISRIPKKEALLAVYLTIALCHQLMQIVLWKDAPKWGAAFLFIAHIAASIQETIVVVWIADNVPT